MTLYWVSLWLYMHMPKVAIGSLADRYLTRQLFGDDTPQQEEN